MNYNNYFKHALHDFIIVITGNKDTDKNSSLFYSWSYINCYNKVITIIF